MDEIRDTAETLTKEGEKAKERVRNIADEALRKGRENWSDLRERGQDMLESARERSSEALEDAQEWVKSYPFQAIGLGVLVGFVVGALVSRQGD